MNQKLEESVYKKLMDIIHEEKPYLKPNLRKRKRLIASRLNLSANDLESLIHTFHGKTFIQLMKSFRIDEAKMLLADPKHEEMKIAEIAFNIGFGNLWDFNLAFKEQEQVNPTEYRAFHLNFKKVMGISPMEYELQ